MRVVALSLVVGALVSTPALACTCSPPGSTIGASPLPGAVVPRNAVIRNVGYEAVPGAFELVVDGEVWDAEYSVERYGSLVVGTYHHDPFPAGASVSLRVPDTDGETVLSFTVGSSFDEEPPTWTGEFVVDSVKDKDFVTCGVMTGHWFTWSGLADETWDAEQLFVFGVPLIDGAEPFVGVGSMATVVQSMCSEGDPTLEEQFHREYELWVEDGAGNRSGPYRISSRGPDAGAGCGCATSTPRGSGLLVGLGLVAAGARRRRLDPC